MERQLGGRIFSGNIARFRVFGRPILGREGDAPKLRARRREFKADFSFIAANRSKEDDRTFLFFRGAFVLHIDEAAASQSRLKKNQRAVGIDRECFGFFFEWLALRILTVKADGNLHEDALAAALGAGLSGCAGHDGSLFLLNPILPGGGLNPAREPWTWFTMSSGIAKRGAAARRVDPWARKCECRVRDKSDEAGRFSAPGREAFPAIVQASRTCAESRRGRGT